MSGGGTSERQMSGGTSERQTAGRAQLVAMSLMRRMLLSFKCGAAQHFREAGASPDAAIVAQLHMRGLRRGK